ncbi:YaiO family outer membrane beta-barrel protein [Lutibacter sp.]|uniref:YaiO family outer membrane beta-barrel protein n=1 Tax=Lutibacter sp. TaxID=1925666 RepID=UPI002735CBDF|nr:YaiO family outer membrane beta-barrel protein [Lutibacter sp.]MDP3312695.1 YaiO family outer membrane beta-barrel protein [Lutibacter sp.]
MKTIPIFKLICFVLVICSSQLTAQKIFTGDPDKSFEVARQLAFNKQRKQAQDTLNLILTKYPDYLDVRSFLGSTYSWDGDYNKARKEFEYVLDKNPKLKDTWLAAINNELWADNPQISFKKSEEALAFFPLDADIMILKAKSQSNIGNNEDALKTINLVLNNTPTHPEAISFKNGLIEKNRKNVIGIGGTVDVYSEVFDPMQLHTLKYSRKTELGSIIAKVNYNRRFSESAFQFEVDLYPKITEGFYAYLNVGVANSFLFPEYRYGAELHKSIASGLETSIGFRALKYSETTTIYTGSITWYTGNSYWSFRPYFTPGDSGTSTSGTLNYRRYGKDAENYFSTSVGIGYSPEFYRFNFEGNENEIVGLKSQKFNIGYNFTTSNNRNGIGTQFGLTHQEISFDLGNYFWIYSFSLNWELKF